MNVKPSEALRGMLGAQSKLNKVAHSTANSSSELIENTVGMIKSDHQFNASSKSLITANEMLGTILDLKA